MDKKERVHHPNHYNKGIEMWDYAHSHNLDFLKVILSSMLQDGRVRMVSKTYRKQNNI